MFFVLFTCLCSAFNFVQIQTEGVVIPEHSVFFYIAAADFRSGCPDAFPHL